MERRSRTAARGDRRCFLPRSDPLGGGGNHPAARLHGMRGIPVCDEATGALLFVLYQLRQGFRLRGFRQSHKRLAGEGFTAGRGRPFRRQRACSLLQRGICFPGKVVFFVLRAAARQRAVPGAQGIVLGGGRVCPPGDCRGLRKTGRLNLAPWRQSTQYRQAKDRPVFCCLSIKNMALRLIPQSHVIV